LRIESEKYRQWQIKYEREMNQMKQRERKREYEAAKAKRNFNQQLTVYRRKYEEAVSCNKRLQQQLQRQEVARNKKFTDLTDGDRLFKEVKTFLEQELDLVAGTEEARIHCDDLIQQRKELSQQITKLRKRMLKIRDEPPAKRRTGSDRSGADSSDEVVKLQEQISDLESEVELRNTEIRDLQIKCSSYDAETRTEQRWAAVHTTVHAKCALKLMFDMAANSRKELLQSEQQIEELTTKKRDLVAMVNERDEQMSEAKRKFDEERQTLHEHHARLEREHQETVSAVGK
uniref:Uncharacterized protein n=1 Tax=Plectus sambesii TaxID=2011161 RepID=A0A914V740_9BILA